MCVSYTRSESKLRWRVALHVSEAHGEQGIYIVTHVPNRQSEDGCEALICMLVLSSALNTKLFFLSAAF